MRLVYVTSWLASTGGGVSAVVEALSKLINSPEIQVSVMGLDDQGAATDRENWRGVQVERFPIFGPRKLGFAPELRRALLGRDPDIVHVHGIWMHPSADVLSWSGGRKPYIVSPHGMLDPWALANSRFKKHIVRLLYEQRHLRGAACIHALCVAEARAIRAFGLKNPICVIPNGVHLPKTTPRPKPPWPAEEADRPVLLFLGRLHPKKNIHGLLHAMAHVKANGKLGSWRLVVAGWDQSGYGAELTRLAVELKLDADVAFLGAVHGERKDAALRNATAFVLPSFSEGLPMAVLEAWAYGLPVAMTAECNIPEGFVAGAAYEISVEPEPLSRELAIFLSLGATELRIMGNRGLELAQSTFSWERAAERFREVYRWLMGQRPAPNFVTPAIPDLQSRRGLGNVETDGFI